MLIVAGNLTLDDTVLPDGRTSMNTVGGDVLYTALGAALWTAPIGLLSRMGEDFPRTCLEDVARAGLDSAGLLPCAGPTIRYWVLYEWDGRRRFIQRTPERRLHDLSPEPQDLPERYARDARAFHVAALPFAQVDRLVRAAAALDARPLVSLDTHEDFVAGYQAQLAALLPLVHVFLPSREEVALWFGDDDPERRIGDLLALGPRVVAIKMGAEGALVLERGRTRPDWVPPVAARVLDVTGAGDAFCGGFVARTLAGAAARDAALAGTVSASFAVEHYGWRGLMHATAAERDARLAAVAERLQRGDG